MDLELTGKVALVTGASRGIGLAIAEGLAAEGVRVALAARSSKALDAAAGALTQAGRDVLAHPCDVSDDETVRTLVDAVLARFGRIDILSPVAHSAMYHLSKL